jgi:hypothetical protein
MPFSYQGFGPAAILVMIACVIAGEAYKRLKRKKQHH